MELTIKIDQEQLHQAVDNAVAKIKSSCDFVIVTRCKNCKHYIDELDCDGQCTGKKRCEHPKLDYEGFCDDFWLAPAPDDFCSYGEEKE